ncbi:MAG: hypothetical protein QGI83_10355 [Candidatus Latescibacteria bacterium]|jgi:hypothetical protein|nr:hypothetical protein [Candidatus Latescibacterota bacterium]
MRVAAWLIPICLCIFAPACSKQATNSDDILSIEDLLVKNNEITGWAYSGTGWTANSISDLTIYINGLADIYQRHGFREAAHQTYRGSVGNADHQLGLTVYDLGNETNAQATYGDPDLGMSAATGWTAGAGTAAQYVRYGGFSQVLAFYRGAYFVHLEINDDTEESLNILKQFALNVDGKAR